MPRAADIYTLPPGIEGVPNATIESTDWNGFTADVAVDLNYPRPIVAGGTGANSAAAARDNLDAEVAGAQVTNYDTHVFENGSFYSASGVPGAPEATAAYVGTAVILTAPNTALLLQARNFTTGDLWVRKKTAGVWGAWVSEAAALDSRFVNVTGDTMSGGLTFGPAGAAVNGPSIFNFASDPNKLTFSGGANGIQFNNQINTVALVNILNNGNVGIGTASPTLGKLHVAGSIYSDTTVTANGNGSRFGTPSLNPYAPTRATTSILLYDFAENNYCGIGVDGSGNMCLTTGASVAQATRLYIQGALSGYVGIGTVVPEQKLDVNGDIRGHTFKPASHLGLNMQATPFSTIAGPIYVQQIAIANPNWSLIHFSAVLYPGMWGGLTFEIEGGPYQFRNGGLAYKVGGGAWLDSSDARIKTVVGDYEPGLAEVLALMPKRFTYKGNDTYGPPQHYSDVEGTDEEVVAKAPKMAPVVPYKNSPHHSAAAAGREFTGLIAQDVEGVIPTMVRKGKGYIDGVEVDDLRDLDPSELPYALVNAIKELNAKIEALQ